MRERIVSGIVLVILLVLILLSGGYVLSISLLLVALVASFEMSRAFALRDTRNRDMDTGGGEAEKLEAHNTESDKRGINKYSGMEVVGYIGVLIHYGFIIRSNGDPRYFIGTVILFFFAETLIYVIRFPAYHISRLSDTIFIYLYAPVMLSFLCLIRDLEFGAWFVWLPFLAWISDTCAYAGGSLFGKHKLCPGLSPNKTVEGSISGFIGSVIISGIYGCALSYFTSFNENVLLACLIIGAACGVFGQLGDLLASGIKRDRGIKDYGRLIPGHGGIMDRFDSVIFLTPLVYFLIKLLLKL